MAHLLTAKHILGVALGVRHWPSRRYMARLRDENRELRRFETLASGCAEAVTQRSERLRNVL